MQFHIVYGSRAERGDEPIDAADEMEYLALEYYNPGENEVPARTK